MSTNTTSRVYKTKLSSKLWWALYLLFSMAAISFCLYFLFSFNLSEFWIPAIFILLITVSACALAFSAITRLTLRLTVANTSIDYAHIFGDKQIDISDVKGFRIISTAQSSDIGLPGWEVEIESVNGTVITVPKSIEDQGELVDLLKSTFVNLDEHAMKVYLGLKGDN